MLFFFELFKEVMLEIVDLDFLGDDGDRVMLGVELFRHGNEAKGRLINSQQKL